MSALKDHKKRLAARKSKIQDLVKGIEYHEQEREEVAQGRKTFSDPKYANSGPTRYSWDEEDGGASMSSSAASAQDEISRMLESESEKKKGKGKKKKKPASPGGSKNKPGLGTRTANAAAISNRRASGTSRGGAKKPLGRERPPLRKLDNDNNEIDPFQMKGVLKTAGKLSDGDVIIKIEDDKEVDSDEEEGFLHIVDALHCFENTKYIFMQRLLDYEDIEAAGFNKKTVDIAYQILNVQGQLLFLLQQSKIKCTGFVVYSKKSFENVLYDVYGNKVLKYIGPSVFMSKMTSKMTVTDSHDRMLGYIKAFGTKVNYSVYNAIGERLFLVVSNLYIPTTTTSFTILCRGQKIGVIKYGWKHTFHDLNYIDYETSGIEFPSEMDEREKALLLGCLMLIEFFWYSPLTRLKLSLLFVGILLITLAIIVICIPLIIDSPGDDPTTKSFYISEKIDKIKKLDEGKEAGSVG